MCRPGATCIPYDISRATYERSHQNCHRHQNRHLSFNPSNEMPTRDWLMGGGGGGGGENTGRVGSQRTLGQMCNLTCLDGETAAAAAAGEKFN